MLSNKAFLACTIGIELITVFGCGARPALAQTPLPAPRRAPPILGPNGDSPRYNPPASLATYLDKLIWDPSTQGNLLIIGPEQTLRARTAFRPVADGQSGRFALADPEPEKSPNGDIVGYKLDTFNDFFARKAVGVHSLSVYAPTMMTVFADRQLPKIDPYAALSSGEKERLLESTFTPDQWQRLADADGIGVSDMTATQRDIYLLLLPDPFVVESNAPAADGSRNANITLTPEQRASVRLSMSRQLSWMFAAGANGGMMMSVGTRARPGEGSGYSLAWRPTGFGLDDRNKAFGVPLTTESPNRSKTDQLTEDLRHSEVMVPLDQDKTLGGLIDRISKATGAELHADKRYARLTIVTRGTSTEAGDLLRAIALGVTGTWRHVGPAYILTNDLEGLGVHHARIADWIARNQMMITAIQLQADTALAGVSEADRVTWRDDDPLKPDAALQAKLAGAAGNPASQMGLFVPLNEMPAAAQSQIADQIKTINDNQSRFTENVGGQSIDRAIRTDGVKVRVSTTSSYVVPGLATMSAQDITGSAVRRFGPRVGPQVSNPTPPKADIVFPDNCPMRALLVAPRDDADIANAVREARRAGFNQLWVQVPRDDTKLLPSAIRQGKASGLVVQAVVRPLQPIAADPPKERDHNLLGESTTEYAHEKRSEINQLGLPSLDMDNRRQQPIGGMRQVTAQGWRDPEAIELLLQKGDYLRENDAEVCKRLIGDLTTMAAAPDLGGLVLRDAYADGYDRVDAKSGSIMMGVNTGVMPINDTLLALGYSEDLRLQAIRTIGCDPIDLSPIPHGDQVQTGGAGPIGFVDMPMPLFRDTGSQTGGTMNGVPESEIGAGDALMRWSQLRADVGDAFVHAVGDGVRAQAASLPVLASSEEAGGFEGYYFGSVDPPGDKPAVAPGNASLIAPGPPTAPAAGGPGLPPGVRQGPRPLTSLRSRAKAASKTAYYGVTITVEGKDTDVDADAQLQLSRGLLRARGWDGVVVDLTELTAARAANLLRAIPDAAPPAPTQSATASNAR